MAPAQNVFGFFPADDDLGDAARQRPESADAAGLMAGHRSSGEVWFGELVGLAELHMDVIETTEVGPQRMRSSPSEPVARRLSAIAGFYRYATDEDLIDRSPVAGRRSPACAGPKSLTTARPPGSTVTSSGPCSPSPGNGPPPAPARAAGTWPCSPCSPTTACASVRRWQPTPPTSAPSEAAGCCTSPAKAAGERQSCSPRSPLGPSTTTSPGGTLAGCSSPAAAVATTNRQRSAWCAASPGPPAWTAPSGSAPTACAMRSSPWPSTPACPCATYRTPPGTPTPRTTRRYDRARHNLDRAATYAVAAYLAGDGP